ncbi:hypothetical protein OAE62_00855, partial [bacterium]|nr:hypothetical protein [bacterium]
YGIAPDGAKTSTRIQYTGGSSYIAESVTPATYTASAFVKGVGGEVVKFGVGANIGQGVEFTLNGQWQRIEHTGTGGTIFFSALGGNTATDFEIWGAQLETGSVATSYIPTSGGDAAARTRAADDLQIERDSTNLVTDSNSFGVYGTTVETTGFEAPDGSNNSTKISNIQDGAGERAHCLVTSVSGSTSYVGAIYIKGTAGQTIRVQAKRYTGDFSGSGTQTITFDGTWQRVTNLAWTSASNNTNALIVIKNEYGTTADEVYLWGAQIEEGSESTSLIPTSGAPASRTTFSDFYNQSEGTLYVEYEPRFTNVTNSALFFFSDGGSQNRIFSLVHQSYNLFIATSAVTVAQFGGGIPQANTLNRVAATFKANDARLSLNGANEVTDTSLTTPSVNQLHIGQRTTLVHQLNGHIKRLIYWPYHSDSL